MAVFEALTKCQKFAKIYALNACMSEYKHRFDFETGKVIKPDVEDSSAGELAAETRIDAEELAKAKELDEARAQEQIEEIKEELSREEAEAREEFEAAEAEAQAELLGLEADPDSQERKDRVLAIKQRLQQVKGRYNEKTKALKEWQKKHPMLSAVAIPLSWPPRIGVWFLQKMDNIADGVLHKIEKWGDKKAPGWVKWGVDWALWPIEKWAGLGRQTDPQADIRAKGQREDKKEADKLIKKGK